MPDQSADPGRIEEQSIRLLRRRLIFADPERSVVRISHDGTQVAFRAPVLPLADSVVDLLRNYLEVRRRAGAPQTPKSGLFWHEQGGQRYGRQAIAWLFVEILRRTGLKPAQGKTGPRIHDLRHSMVVNRILEWYRAGIDAQDRLPFLATYRPILGIAI